MTHTSRLYQVVSSEDAKKINEARKVKKLFPMNYPSGWKDFKVKHFKK